MKIITNNKFRPTLTWNDLTPKEQREFDYLEREDEKYGAAFIRYNKVVYKVGEFMRINNNPDLKDWDGYVSDTYFSGVLVKFDRECEMVKMGRYYS